MELQKPNWKKWANIPTASLAIAVALSMDIEPATITQGSIERVHDKWDEYQERLEVAIANLHSAGPLKPLTLVMSNPAQCVVSLASFYVWARSVSWTLPVEISQQQTISDARSTPGPNNPEDHSIERETLLKQIAGIAILLAQDKGCYQRGSGKVNSSAIANAIINLLEELPVEAKIRGLGHSTLRANIQAGLDLLKI